MFIDSFGGYIVFVRRITYGKVLMIFNHNAWKQVLVKTFYVKH